MISNGNLKIFEMNTSIRNFEGLRKIVPEARKAQQLSQEDLAGMAGTGRRFIVDLEKGKETTQFDKVLRVLATLGVSVIASREWD